MRYHGKKTACAITEERQIACVIMERRQITCAIVEKHFCSSSLLQNSEKILCGIYKPP